MGSGLRGAEEVAIVGCSLVCAAEDVVGFGDLDEAVGGFWVVWIVIRVVFLAQLEELSVFRMLI